MIGVERKGDLTNSSQFWRLKFRKRKISCRRWNPAVHPWRETPSCRRSRKISATRTVSMLPILRGSARSAGRLTGAGDCSREKGVLNMLSQRGPCVGSATHARAGLGIRCRLGFSQPLSGLSAAFFYGHHICYPTRSVPVPYRIGWKSNRSPWRLEADTRAICPADSEHATGASARYGEGSRENYEEDVGFSLSVLFASRPHSSQIYETSTRSGVRAIDVACTNRISNLQVGQLGDAGTEAGPTSDEGDT